MAKNFDGKVALITGAARGIGAGVAKGFAARGGKVALVGLEPEELQKVVAEIGDAAAWWEADVRDNDAVHLAVDAAAAHFGRIDYVLANAGIASYGTVRQIDNDSFERVVDININGVYRTLHATIPYLEMTKGYALVVASLSSFTPLAGMPYYNASKACSASLAITTKQEVAHMCISFGVCDTSWLDTDIVRTTKADIPSFSGIRYSLHYPATRRNTSDHL